MRPPSPTADERLLDLAAITRVLLEAVQGDDLDAARGLLETRGALVKELQAVTPADSPENRRLEQGARRESEAVGEALEERKSAWRAAADQWRRARQTNEALRPYRSTEGGSLDVSY